MTSFMGSPYKFHSVKTQDSRFKITIVKMLPTICCGAQHKWCARFRGYLLCRSSKSCRSFWRVHARDSRFARQKWIPSGKTSLALASQRQNVKKCDGKNTGSWCSLQLQQSISARLQVIFCTFWSHNTGCVIERETQ